MAQARGHSPPGRGTAVRRDFLVAQRCRAASASGSRCTHSDTASTHGSGSPTRVTVVRRSAHIRPRPLQNVATSKRSAKRGNSPTR